MQTITLTATGTPTAPAGNATFSVTAGGGTCSFQIPIVTVVVSDYFPRTANSNWSFELDDVATDSLLMVATNLTHTVATNSYTIFAATDDASLGYDTAGYYRRNGGDYYRYTNLADYIGFDNDYYQEFIFLKDNLAAGQTWTSPSFAGTITINGTPTPMTIHMKYKILQQNTNISVPTSAGNKNYSNVIVVEERYEKLVGGNWIDLTSDPNFGGYYVDYYARNIGWVLSEARDQTGAIGSKLALRRSAIY